MKQKGFSAVLILLVMLIVAGGLIAGVYYLKILKNPGPQTQNSVITSGLPQTSPATANTESLITLLDSKIPADVYKIIDGNMAPCQPEFFDPKTTKFSKVKTEGLPSELYQIAGEKYPTMMIDGWDKEGKEKVYLPSPYDVTIYHFGCASSSSYVIDLYKNLQRQALYTHVTNWSFSKDKKFLFLANNLKVEDKWQRLRRIIDVTNNTTKQLPSIDCVDETGSWDNNRLITYSDKNKASFEDQKKGYLTKMCIWDTTGKLLYRFEGDLDWYGASKDGLWAQVGLLPNETSIFYAFQLSRKNNDPEQCSLYLQDLENSQRHKEVILFKRNNPDGLLMCPTVEFDFSNTTFDSQTVNYKPSQNQKNFPVIKLNTEYGIPGLPAPSYPPSVSVSIPDNLTGQLTAYGAASQVILGPKNWTGQGSVGADGNSGIVLYPQGSSSDKGVRIEVFIASTGTGSALYEAASYFPWIQNNWQQLKMSVPAPSPKPGLNVVPVTSHLLKYTLPKTSDNLEINGIIFSNAQDHIKDGMSAASRMEVVMSQANHDLANYLLDYFVQQQGLDKQ